MAWKGVVTNSGNALCARWMSGERLSIDAAAAGMGTVDEMAMLAQTALVDQRQNASIISNTLTEFGQKIKLQLTAAHNSYTLNQYGIWGHVGKGESVLLALFQNSEGVIIPSAQESPDFVYTFYATLPVSNTGELVLNIDPNGIVTEDTLKDALTQKADLVDGKVPSSQLPEMNYDSSGSAQKVRDELNTHTANKNNPHHVTPSLIGAVPTGRKINDKPLTGDISLAADDVGAVPASQKGSAGGVASLGADGKVPSSQLPSYVDDVVEGYFSGSTFYEDAAHTRRISPEAGKIYVDLSGTNKTYRWGGSAYVEISASLALGETSSTAYRGDRGKIAYDHSKNATAHITTTERGKWNGAAAHDTKSVTDEAGVHGLRYHENKLQVKTESGDFFTICAADGGMANAGAHNAIYRGEFLWNSVTALQYAQISAGTFEDMYIGDYWTIGGINYRIAAFDYYLNKGDTNCTAHHIVLVPDTCLYNAQMNGSNTTDGGYYNSAMYTANLEQAKTIIKAAFSGHVLKHRILLTNTVTNGKVSGCSFYDSEVDLMTERMVYGNCIVGSVGNGTTVPYIYTVEQGQLPLFALEPGRISNRAHYWLRDVATAADFALVSSFGHAVTFPASYSTGVRPAFCISSEPIPGI